jgi:hypothetical protein
MGLWGNLVNAGAVDNTAGHLYIRGFQVTGAGTWAGAQEHAPLRSVSALGGPLASEGYVQAVRHCGPSLTVPGGLPSWARDPLLARPAIDDGSIQAAFYEGFRFTLAGPATCVPPADAAGAPTYMFRDWRLSGTGAPTVAPAATGPTLELAMPAGSLLVAGVYDLVPSPSPSSTLATTGVDPKVVAPTAGWALLLTAAGAALVALALALRRRQVESA